MRRAIALLAFVVAAPVPAADLSVTVTGGAADQTDVPVCVAIRTPWANGQTVASLSDGSQRVAGQVTTPGVAGPGNGQGSELHFTLPTLKAGESKTFAVQFGEPDVSPRSAGFAWSKDGPRQLSLNARPVLRYVAPVLDETDAKTKEDTFKIYHHVYNPAGTKVITKGTGGQFTHHRGLFYGFNNISYGTVKCDIWHGTKDKYKTMSAWQSADAEPAAEAGPVVGRHRVSIGWHGPDKKLFAVETRELTCHAVPGGTLIDFTSKLESQIDTPIKLDGDPQHAGFHFRADNEVSEKTKGQTYYLRPDGKGKPGETRNWDAKNKGPVNLPWNAMSFVLGDQRYTVAYLDHPSNPKEARYSERDYGRFGSYFVAEVTKAKPLVVTYRVWVQDGETDGARVEALSKAFVDPPKATAKPGA